MPATRSCRRTASPKDKPHARRFQTMRSRCASSLYEPRSGHVTGPVDNSVVLLAQLQLVSPELLVATTVTTDPQHTIQPNSGRTCATVGDASPSHSRINTDSFWASCFSHASSRGCGCCELLVAVEHNEKHMPLALMGNGAAHQ